MLRPGDLLAQNGNYFAQAGPMSPDHLGRFTPKPLDLERMAVRVTPINNIAADAAP